MTIALGPSVADQAFRIERRAAGGLLTTLRVDYPAPLGGRRRSENQVPATSIR